MNLPHVVAEFQPKANGVRSHFGEKTPRKVELGGCNSEKIKHACTMKAVIHCALK